MKNAKTELLENLKNNAELKCARITLGRYYNVENKTYILKLGHSKNDLEVFLNSIDFVYDSGYGGQELFGTLWLKDDTWMGRGEYDGSEWWEHHILPKIPEDMIF